MVATLRFTAYDRNGFKGGAERVGICPEHFPQVVQSRALKDLRAVLDEELAAARREGSIELPAAVPYQDATFNLSSDPEQLILSFRIRHGFNGSRSMRLYGDGRLELRLTGKGVIHESFDRSLSYPVMVELVRAAVDHGFAEWDRDGLHFHGITARSTHAQRAVGELHLETYQRGDYARGSLTRLFEFGDVGMAREHSTEVLQVKGLEALIRELDYHFDSARSRADDDNR